MVLPIVLPRSEHTLSRRDVDPDALKVLFRLQQLGHTAYLVGGSVRDLLIDRRPKDFDIGTSASPHEIKRAFRNCWIIGRRFRLAHVKFGTKTIEVATFRRNVRAEAEEEKAEAHLAEQRAEAERLAPGDVDGNVDETNGNHAGNGAPRERTLTPKEAAQAARDLLIQRDNTYGTPEEDAFRRDFTINGLFYDAAAKTVIDYVGGLEDLGAGIVRSIGDPLERFQEDPVRMLRAVVMADRLGFKMDDLVVQAIETLGPHIRQAAPARLLEEYYKILRSGAGERVFQGLARNGLIEHISPEMEEGLSAEFFESLARLDAYRARFESAPDTLTNTILLGSLLVPLGLMDGASRRYGVSHQWYPALGRLPIPKKDVERLQHLLALQPRLLDLDSPPRTQQALMHRSVFREALTWLEIYGDQAGAVQHWHALLNDPLPSLHPHAAQPEGFDPDHRRRRRRRRRRPYNSLQP
jgi:poly(A) polymerase